MADATVDSVEAELGQLYCGTDKEAEQLRKRRKETREQRLQRVVATLDRLASIPELSPPSGAADSAAWDIGEGGGGVRLDWAALNGADPAADPRLSDRGERKRLQLESLLQLVHTHVLRVPARVKRDRSPRGITRVVDFGSGTGHFGLLVAATMPDTVVTLVDTDQHQLDIAHARVASLGPAVASRVTICCGTTADYSDSFDFALCLHGCGRLTDDAIAQAVRNDAAFCCVPCCYSELVAPASAAFAAQEWLDAAAFQQLSRAAEHPGTHARSVARVHKPHCTTCHELKIAWPCIQVARLDTVCLWNTSSTHLCPAVRCLRWMPIGHLRCARIIHITYRSLRGSRRSAAREQHVLMGWVDPEASSHANQPERRSTFAPRRAGTAAPVELVELVDGLPWLS